jgi:hypothetical protein
MRKPVRWMWRPDKIILEGGPRGALNFCRLWRAPWRAPLGVITASSNGGRRGRSPLGSKGAEPLGVEGGSAPLG